MSAHTPVSGGSLPDLGAYRIGLFSYDGGTEQGCHAHAFTTVSMVLSGTVREDVGHHAVEAGPLQVVVKPRGTLHANRFTARHSRLIQIAIGPELVRRAIDGGAPLTEWSWSFAAGPVVRAFVRLARQSRRDAPAPSVRGTLLDLFAGLGNRTLAMADVEPPAWLRRARQALQSGGGQGPSVSELADFVGVHRVHLSRAYQRYYGMSPTEAKMRIRMRRAVAAVGSTEMALSDAAYANGYADQAHMNREFRSRLGTTPLKYRNLAAGWAPPAGGCAPRPPTDR